jgi:hypothetical protein
MKNILVGTMIALLTASGTTPMTAAPPASSLSAQDARDIAIEAYIYLYPLITMEITRLQLTNVPAGSKPLGGPMNAFSHIRSYPTAEFREVVRPNFDTLYSGLWLDLRKEPVVLSVPDTGNRYYVFPMMDMWTDVFMAAGTRTTGNGSGQFGIVAPGWKGTLPAEVRRIDAPTPYVWIIVRTQTNGPADYEAVRKVQDGYRAAPLSQLNAKPIASAPARIDPTVDVKTPPLEQVNAMLAAKYFALGAKLMGIDPPHVTDQSILARMRRIGLEPGKPFDVDALAPVVKSAVTSAPADGLAAMRAKLPTLARVSNGWQMNTDTMGVYGNFYLKRAIIALVGLGANLQEDAVYPLNIADGDGKPLDGANDYVMHIAKAELPPVDAFWSITMYDRDGFQAANELNRFAIGDRDSLKYNADGSLDIYLQNRNPGPDRVSNWLPAPKGPLGVTMRLYAPKPQVLDGRWVPPVVKRVQ